MRNAGEIPGSRPASQSGGTRKKRLGVYIHYPFCVRKCAYCDFLSAPGSDLVREAYLAALCREIREMEHVFRNAEIRSVFIGGGTPSLMSPEDFIRLSDALHDAALDWEPDAEWTIEAHPGTVTPEKARCWKAQGQYGDAGCTERAAQADRTDPYDGRRPEKFRNAAGCRL